MSLVKRTVNVSVQLTTVKIVPDLPGDRSSTYSLFRLIISFAGFVLMQCYFLESNCGEKLPEKKCRFVVINSLQKVQVQISNFLEMNFII